MRKKIPRVEDGRLFQSESEGDPILVGTPAWYDWLEQQSSFIFVDQALTFTARRACCVPGGPTGKHTAGVKASSTASTWDTRTR